jgi:DNA polymerase delta subunit 1
MIECTKNFIESKYTQKNGFQVFAGPNEDGVVVVYGDTDSVMVYTNSTDLKYLMWLGDHMAKHTTYHIYKTFNLDQCPPDPDIKLEKGAKLPPKGPVELTFEKIYMPYLLVQKKRYAGIKWLNPNTPEPGVEVKGLESARRDNCMYLTRVITESLMAMMKRSDVEEAQNVVRNAVSDLLNGRIDVSELVITKSFSKENYKNPQAHMEVVRKMRERDYGSAPVLGDRVPYVMTRGLKGVKQFKCAEDPLYVIENELPIDYNWYLSNQLTKPIKRIFGAVMDNPVSLINGDHSKTITKNESGTFGIMKYAIKYDKCIVCNVMIREDNECPNSRNVCNLCIKDEQKIYSVLNRDRNALEKKHSELWTQCQRCQGDMHRPVLCSNKDCPIFFARTQAKKDLSKMDEKIRMFSGIDDW